MHLKLPEQNSEIVFTREYFYAWVQQLQNILTNYSSSVIISDEKVYSLHGKQLFVHLQNRGLPVAKIVLPSGEQTKSLIAAQHCWTEMHSKGLDRRSCIIALGGGVISDLAGFVASCYLRSIDVIFIPTTLLGMVDAAIGGKTAINLKQGKNLIGSFHHPIFTIINPLFLNTLPQREFCSGLAEVVKYGVIWDPILFDYLENNIKEILKRDPEKLDFLIKRSCEIKTEIVKRDAKGKHLRNILNWGHSFAHAIEAGAEYCRYSHGEAVSIGMSCAAHISHRLGFATEGFIKKQDMLCQNFGLPVDLPDLPIDTIINFMGGDKKTANGKINLIVARKVGKVFCIENIEKSTIREILVHKGHALYKRN